MSGTHDQDDPDRALAARVQALESLLVDRGLVDPDALEQIVEFVSSDLGPRHGARAVARAWIDPDFAARLRLDASAALAELGIGGRQGEHMVADFNTPQRHHIVVCTLCSCYPWPVLGLPPAWYKSPAYRARVVRDPRGVCAEFGLVLPTETDILVRDSTAEVRYLVVPERPPGTEGWSEAELATLVSRNSMIGTALATVPTPGSAPNPAPSSAP